MRTLFIFIQLLLWFFVPFSSQAAGFDYLINAKRLGAGFVSTAQNTDPLFVFSNPAIFYENKNWCIATAYSRPYGIKEMETTAAAIAKRWHSFEVTLGGCRYGFELYNEQTAALAIAFPWSESIRVGIGCRYQQTQIKNYNQAAAFLIDLGWHISINKKTAIHGGVQNLLGATIGQCHQPLPQVLTMGMQISPAANIFLYGEAYKDIDYSPEGRFGIEICSLPNFVFRTGFTRNPSRFTGGFSFSSFGLTMDYGFSYHTILGYTHSLGLTISK